MNRRAFFTRTVGVVVFGYAARHANAEGVHLGINAPAGFPEFNWIDFREPILSITNVRDYQLVICSNGLYRLDGCRGPFEITGREKRRLWSMHLDERLATVIFERRHY